MMVKTEMVRYMESYFETDAVEKNEDFTYVGGFNDSGQARLDECNGGKLDGVYVYFVTNSQPYVSRCLVGVVSDDFNKANHNAERGQRSPRGQNREGRSDEGPRGERHRGEGRRGEGRRSPRQGN